MVCVAACDMLDTGQLPARDRLACQLSMHRHVPHEKFRILG